MSQHDELHAVPGRSRALRDAVGKHGPVCRDSTFRGLKAKHRFACDYRSRAGRRPNSPFVSTDEQISIHQENLEGIAMHVAECRRCRATLAMAVRRYKPMTMNVRRGHTAAGGVVQRGQFRRDTIAKLIAIEPVTVRAGASSIASPKRKRRLRPSLRPARRFVARASAAATASHDVSAKHSAA